MMGTCFLIIDSSLCFLETLQFHEYLIYSDKYCRKEDIVNITLIFYIHVHIFQPYLFCQVRNIILLAVRKGGPNPIFSQYCSWIARRDKELMPPICNSSIFHVFKIFKVFIKYFFDLFFGKVTSQCYSVGNQFFSFFFTFFLMF